MGNAAPMFAATLLCGYASTIVLDAIGLRRRGLLAHAWVLILTPLYWLLLSLAAWRALLQLWRDPQRWEKTEHGLAKTSRVSGTRISISNRSPAIRTGYSPLAPAAIMARSRGPMLEFARDDQALFPVLRRKRRKRSSDAAPILSTRPFDSHQGGLS
jgi:hypothetical protein